MSTVTEHFAWLEALKEELRADLLRDLGVEREWVNQEQSVIGRVRHIRCCRRLIRAGSSDAHYNASTKVWWLRRDALKLEIERLNQRHAARIETEIFEAERPAVSKARPQVELEPEDDTGVYERELLRKWGAQ